MGYLWLDDNLLSGTLPDSIGNCTELVELSLSNNLLSGPIPESLDNIKGVSYLVLGWNSFTGKIPLIPSSCKELQELEISSNPFGGEIPSGIGNCTRLSKFGAVDSSLSGQIPSSVGLLAELSILYLSSNALSGLIPPEVGNCKKLESLELYSNQLQGPIPREIGKLNSLKSLFLFSNRFTGEIPVEIWRIPTLENLLLYENSLTGELPLEMTKLKNLKNISLFSNQFTGVIPQALGINSSLVSIDFTNNSFSGEIPPHICAGRELRVLNLGHNLLHGSVPSEVGNCSSLVRLILGPNNLTGELPEFANNSSLLYMDLSLNRLSGTIPQSLGNCVNLTTIKWSRNKLFGPIPQVIGKLANLQVLNLSYNGLTGQLPQQISRCSKMYLLDLGFNNLNGSIPSSLTNLTLLSRLKLQGNQFSGGIPDFFPKFTNLLEVQLGGNTLGGTIPSSLGSLHSLQIALNLSSNELTGEVPFQLGSLNSLQRLDLSLNNLTGSLSSLAGLSSLLEVNVSFNHFKGPVPEKWMKLLDSSPNSFLGNPGLCISCRAGDSSCVKSTVLNFCGRTSGNKKGFSKIHVILLVLGSSFICFLVCLALGCALLRLKKAEAEEMPSLHQGSSFLLNKVLEVTENLNGKYELGRGAQGTVYKATISPENVYAVKKLVFDDQQGSNSSMLREIQTLGKIRHRNLVKLVDFWLRKDYGLILYEFMEGGSLHHVLHELKPAPVLEWHIRYRVALGTAQGLAYLHEDCNPSIIHRDIKPKNILLDSDMEPHIADFGIAKIMDQISSASHSTAVMGTIGYFSPETAFSTRKSKESDVYSYGVVLLELLTRKKALDEAFQENIDIVGWVCSTLHSTNDMEAVIDPDLMDEIVASVQLQEEVDGVLLLAFRCVSKVASERPTMREVVKELTDMKSNAGSLGKEARHRSSGNVGK